MGGRGGRLSILMREIVRFRGMESVVDEGDKVNEQGGGDDSPVGSVRVRKREGGYI